MASFDNVRVLKRINVPERKRRRLEYIKRKVFKARLCRQGFRLVDYDAIWFPFPILSLQNQLTKEHLASSFPLAVFLRKVFS